MRSSRETGLSVSSSRWTGPGHSQTLKAPKVRLPATTRAALRLCLRHPWRADGAGPNRHAVGGVDSGPLVRWRPGNITGMYSRLTILMKRSSRQRASSLRCTEQRKWNLQFGDRVRRAPGSRRESLPRLDAISDLRCRVGLLTPKRHLASAAMSVTSGIGWLPIED
jgi:hypothetical protein